MSIEQVTSFLGWATVVNCVIVSVSMVVFLLFRSAIISIHSQLFNVENKALNVVYIQYFAFFKVLIVFFNLVPYLCFKFFV